MGGGHFGGGAHFGGTHFGVTHLGGVHLGGYGGGIYSAGANTLLGCAVNHNNATAGAGNGGVGSASGGGIYNDLSLALFNCTIVSNTAGITGGIRLWEPDLDELFRGEPMAQAHHNVRQP